MSVSLGLQAFHPFLPMDPKEIEREEKHEKPFIQRTNSSISFLLNPQDEDNGLEVAGLFALAEMRNSSDFFSSSSSLPSQYYASSPYRSFSAPSPAFYFEPQNRPFAHSDFYSRSAEFQTQRSESPSSPPFRSLPSSPTSSFSLKSRSYPSPPLSPVDSYTSSPGSSPCHHSVGSKRGRAAMSKSKSPEKDQEESRAPLMPTGAPGEDPRQFWNFYQKGGSREVKDPILGKVIRSYLACSEKKRGCPAELVVSVTSNDVNHFKPQHSHNHLPPKRLRVKKCTKTH